MENKNLDVLDEINKGATMGMDAIKVIMDKTNDDTFKEVLNIEYDKYQDISNRVNKIYDNYSTEKEPHETNVMNKMMIWYGIQMRTMNEKTISHYSELLMQGTNMGIIEGRKLINHNTDLTRWH